MKRDIKYKIILINLSFSHKFQQVLMINATHFSFGTPGYEKRNMFFLFPLLYIINAASFSFSTLGYGKRNLFSIRTPGYGKRNLFSIRTPVYDKRSIFFFWHHWIHVSLFKLLYIINITSFSFNTLATINESVSLLATLYTVNVPYFPIRTAGYDKRNLYFFWHPYICYIQHLFLYLYPCL